jgi:hypothetical protein
MSEPTATVGVTYELLQVEHVRNAGSLIDLASVEVTIAGVAVVLQGVRVMRRTDDGSLECLAPAWRHPRTAKWLPCLLLPPKLSAALATEVLEAISDPRASINSNSGRIAA